MRQLTLSAALTHAAPAARRLWARRADPSTLPRRRCVGRRASAGAGCPFPRWGYHLGSPNCALATGDRRGRPDAGRRSGRAPRPRQRRLSGPDRAPCADASASAIPCRRPLCPPHNPDRHDTSLPQGHAAWRPELRDEARLFGPLRWPLAAAAPVRWAPPGLHLHDSGRELPGGTTPPIWRLSPRYERALAVLDLDQPLAATRTPRPRGEPKRFSARRVREVRSRSPSTRARHRPIARAPAGRKRALLGPVTHEQRGDPVFLARAHPGDSRTARRP